MKLLSLLFSKPVAIVVGFLFLLTIDELRLTAPPHAADRTNVPLKNWGGFSLYRSWIYEGLEKIVLAGLAEEVHLNTKPLSRVEAARIVAQAVRRLKWDRYGDYNHRGYLEETLYRLVKEFGRELAEMGVRTPLNKDAVPAFFGFQPIENVQFGIGLTSRSTNLVNSFGKRLDKGFNRLSTLDGRLHIGDFFSLYYQPEFSWGESRQGRLGTGYGKLKFWNVELEAGRDSAWWGPGFRGSMSLSNNARPMNLVRLSSAEPFRLPWVLNSLGSWKLVTFVSQLESDRDVPDAKLSGTRISLAPSRFVELGFNRMFQFGGRGRNPNFGQFLKILAFNQGADDNPESPEQVNNVMSFDATVRIPDVERYILFARDMTLYADFGWDDTAFGLFVPDSPGGLVGFYLSGLFGDPKLDFRLEYARTSDLMFNHFVYTSGFAYRGSVLSHFIGTEGSELYARLTRWMTPDLFVGLTLSHGETGSTESENLGSPREERSSFGFDLSYRLSDRSSIFLGYTFAKVNNRGFVAGRSGNDNILRFEFTRSFGE